VEFGREFNALVGQRRYLDVVQPYADAFTNSSAGELIERKLVQLQTRRRSMAEQVRTVLQDNMQAACLRANDPALILGLTKRQLRRRLAMEGVSLGSLVDQARRDHACRELRSGTSIKTVASQLNFSEPSAFHRAFKRWTGQTPHDYARQPDHASWSSSRPARESTSQG
jgi:AraC-like DNA-binding protein